MCRTSVHSHFFFIANTPCEIVPFGLLLLLLSHFSRVRLCDPIDGSPPGSAVPGILQAGTLEWVAISFSNARKWKVKVKSLSRVRPLATWWTAAYHAPPSIGLSRQEYWSGVPLKGYIYLISVFRYVFHFVRQSVMNIHWKDWCWSWNCNILATWCEELTPWKRSWYWERLKAGGEGDDRGWGASPTWWTWVWESSRSWWWTGGLACCGPWGRKEPDMTGQLNWTEPNGT